MSEPKSYPIYEKRHASGNVGFRVDMGVLDGKRVYRSFGTRPEAETFQIKCRETDARNRPIELHNLSQIAHHEVHAALAKLQAHNANITEAVDFYLKHARPPKGDATIETLMKSFDQVKRKSGKSSQYLDTARESFFKPFKEHFKNCALSDLTFEGCEKYIYQSKKWTPTTRASHLRHLSVLLNFAVQRGHLSLNPFRKVERPKRIESKASSKVATVKQVATLLKYAFEHDYKEECVALVLVLFCGVRAGESARVTWENIHLDGKRPEVVLEETKNSRRRTNPIPPNAVAWLSALKGKGKLVGEHFEGRMRHLRKVAKAGFKQNSARICFASYHIAMHRDGARTAVMLGHQNPSLLYNTYRAVVRRDDAERYWTITPTCDGSEISTVQVSEEEAKKHHAQRLAKAVNG